MNDFRPYPTANVPGNKRSDGRAVEGASLLRKYTGNGIRGSNPRHSEKKMQTLPSGSVCVFYEVVAQLDRASDCGPMGHLSGPHQD